MPRQRKRADFEPIPLPIEGKDVATIFRRATVTPPYPDMRTCDLIAEALNGIAATPWVHRRFARSQQGIRLREAIRTILRFVEGSGWVAADYVPMCEGLRNLECRYFSAVRPSAAPWIINALPVWYLAEMILDGLGRHAGKTADSVAIKFTALALERIGFKAVSRRALANWIIEVSTATAA